MAVDHSLTYRKFRLRNVPHIFRLKKIKQVVAQNFSMHDARYADIGCSNGYITDIVSHLISASETVGFDHSDNLDIARQNYPDHQFSFIDLNQACDNFSKFHIVTCFETLEHVGDVKMAIRNMIGMLEKGGVLIISVPIEIGPWGLVKYLLKRGIYRYDLPLVCGDKEYLYALLKGLDISAYRPELDGYGSHFGFDYRIIDRFLLENYKMNMVKTFNSFTTRFYLINA